MTVDNADNEKAPSASAAGGNPFDPTNILVSQEFEALAGVQQVLTDIPTKRRPDAHDFIRVHPDVEYRVPAVGIVRHQTEKREVTYLVQAALVPEVGDQLVKLYAIFLAVNRHGKPFLWLARRPRDEDDSWATSMLVCVEEAQTRWIRVDTRTRESCYVAFAAAADLGEPKWPEAAMPELLRLGFGESRLISSLDHAVLLELRGEK